LGLRELGTSGEKIPLLSTANTWSARQTFNGGITGALTGNADTATKLKTARTIGGVAFDGSANINLPGVNTTGNQNTTGNAATATKLATARNINGVKFDGSGDVNINTLVSRGRVTALSGSTQGTAGIQMYEAYNNSYPTTYGNVLHMKGASAAGEGELLIGWSGTSGAHAPVFIRSRRDNTDAAWSAWAQVYTSRDSIPGVNATGNQNTTGNAATATKLQTARTIGGVSFDGTANINLPGVNVAGNQNTSGNAATATKLQTARTINGVSFDGSKNIELTPRSIGSINSATMSFSGGAGWFKLATVTMPQASSVVYISLIGGAGYNVGSPQQAGISELVLRAGNGNPKGITGALWRRTSVGFTNFAWVNTSGDTYDIYVEIGNYATGVNIQWDYTKDATVQIHTSPTYTANKPTGLTDGTVYVIYSSHIKPTATDVGALPITGGNLNGGLTATGEIISKSANGLRIAYGKYGFFIRNDGSSTYFMLTDSGNSLGTYNRLRPLIINNANGAVTIGNGLNVTGGINGSLNGNAATATKLQTARTIGGVSFDGSANINLPGVNIAGNQNTTGNAATATKLQTARTINGVSFDGSKNIELTPRSIGSINSATMSFSGGAGWFKLATVTMPQASSVVYISLIGGAGYNVGSPQQAGISELVLRAGNGNPKGITGALWRRTSVGFTNFAWVNTSGDTYDIYVEIGNYATGVNIQWDYTKDATVQIHTSPTYTANKPTGLTDGTVYVIYSSHIKPTATDVGALPITGGNLNGGLTATGEIISKSANGLRIAYGKYGFFIRNDGSSTYFMLTDSGNSLGTYNRLRPLIINNANGAVTIGNGLNVTGGINGSLNGNAATATKLQTARTIGGVSFDGSANINLPGVNIAGNQNTTGNAATATKLQTARTINGVSFDGSKNIELTAEDLNL
ncbi:beta strand repeat-containing protein, partial [Escherichia coli]|uniref:beta strand repeat-containing protein n=1 Tax=Escherichia coli TaxID=562 RepID=UPI00396595F0